MTPRKSSRAAARRQYLAMGGRELVLALAPEAGQGVARKVDVEGPSDSLAQCPPHPNPLPTWERESAEVAECISQQSAPTPDPSPLLADARGGGESAECGEREHSEIGEGQQAQAPSLVARVQALYEDSAVPVREIAQLAGVTERALYKYARKGGWRQRYAVKPRGEAAAAGNRGRRWQRAPGHDGVKGAGGRFVPRAEAGRPVAQGLKALDPKAREQASVACAAAGSRAAKARAKADAAQVWKVRLAAIKAVSAAMAAYNRFRATRAKDRSPVARARDNGVEELYLAQIEAAMACLRKLKM